MAIKKAVKKSSAKAPAKKAVKKSARKGYSKGSAALVGYELAAMKKGKLRSSTGQKVTNPKQAIAIGLSKAEKKGLRVPKKKA